MVSLVPGVAGSLCRWASSRSAELQQPASVKRPLHVQAAHGACSCFDATVLSTGPAACCALCLLLGRSHPVPASASLQGADVSVGKWIYSNLIPATIGELQWRTAAHAQSSVLWLQCKMRRPTSGPCLKAGGAASLLRAGNWIGGAFMVGLLSAGIYGTVGAKAWAAWERGTAAVERKLGSSAPSGRRASVGHVH